MEDAESSIFQRSWRPRKVKAAVDGRWATIPNGITECWSYPVYRPAKEVSQPEFLMGEKGVVAGEGVQEVVRRHLRGHGVRRTAPSLVPPHLLKLLTRAIKSVFRKRNITIKGKINYTYLQLPFLCDRKKRRSESYIDLIVSQLINLSIKNTNR